jgi:hypothetical protein
MVTGINSLVKGERSTRQVVAVAFVHPMFGVVGGCGMALLVWLLVTPLRTILPNAFVLALVVVIAGITAAADAHLIEIPRHARQVPQSWYRAYGPVRSYALYGLWLGAGLASNVTYAVEYTVFIGAGLLLPLPWAVAAGVLFGLGRTTFVGLLGSTTATTSWWARLYRRHQRPLLLLGTTLSVAFAVTAIAL